MTRAHVRWSGVRPSHSTPNRRLSQTSHLFALWCDTLEVRMAWNRCIVILRGEDPAKTTNHFYLPRFLLQEIIFAHSPYEVSIPISRAFRRNVCGEQIGFACEEMQKQRCSRSKHGFATFRSPWWWRTWIVDHCERLNQ